METTEIEQTADDLLPEYDFRGIAGKRVRRVRLVRTARFVVAVEVEAVIPEDDPGEPCYEAETVQLLREIAERAERGEVDWLRQHGQVYEALQVA